MIKKNEGINNNLIRAQNIVTELKVIVGHVCHTRLPSLYTGCTTMF